MQPARKTVAELTGVLEELKQREPIFHRPEMGTSREDFERMTAEDFWEVGASGRCYSRDWVLDELDRRYATQQVDILTASDFYCRKLADNIYLLTYNLLQDHVRKTRRSTIWQLSEEGWKIVFHQGTLVQDE